METTDNFRGSLQKFEVEHISDRYIGWLNDPEVMAFTEARFQSHNRASAKRYISESVVDENCRLFRILIDDNRHVGNIRLSSIRWAHRRADVAIIIGEKDCWGMGIASSAIALVAEIAFRDLKLHKLSAGCYAINAGAIKSFQKAGFVVEAHLKDDVIVDGEFVDGVLLRLLAPDE